MEYNHGEPSKVKAEWGLTNVKQQTTEKGNHVLRQDAQQFKYSRVSIFVSLWIR